MDVQALIMCGGKGTRLRPLTDVVPKPLVELNGRPCLDYILRSHIRRGQTQFVLCVGYKGDMIRDFVRRSNFEADIVFSDAGEDASMLQRLHDACAHVGDRMSVTYGDTLIDVDFPAMLQRHREREASMTLTTAEVVSPFGLLTIDEQGMVASYREKPSMPYFVGHMIAERAVLAAAPADLLAMPDGQGLVALFQRLVDEGALAAFPYAGPQVTFNTPQDIDRAERDLDRFFTQTDGGDE